MSKDEKIVFCTGGGCTAKLGCRLISRGALISMAVILVVLPAALMLLDCVIRHTTMHWLVPESSNAKKSDKD